MSGELAPHRSSMAPDGGSGRRLLVTVAGWLRALLTPVPGKPGFWQSLQHARAPMAIVILCGGVFAMAAMFAIDASSIVAARRLDPRTISAFNIYTDFGKSGWFLYPLAGLLLLLALLPKGRMSRFDRGMAGVLATRIGFLFVAIGLPSLFTTIVKRIIGRGRPFVGGEADPFLYDLFNFDARFASFPSGHSTTAFAVAVAFASLWPKLRWPMALYAVLMLISRVVVTAHHPSDVIAGAVVGLIGALMVRQWFAVRGLAFTVAADGTARPRSLPSWAQLRGFLARRLGLAVLPRTAS